MRCDLYGLKYCENSIEWVWEGYFDSKGYTCNRCKEQFIRDYPSDNLVEFSIVWSL